jgi:hypothetical protein
VGRLLLAANSAATRPRLLGFAAGPFRRPLRPRSVGSVCSGFAENCSPPRFGFSGVETVSVRAGLGRAMMPSTCVLLAPTRSREPNAVRRIYGQVGLSAVKLGDGICG